MPKYLVTASVTVDVGLTLEAASEEEAKALFREGIIMSASMDLDTPYGVTDDSITDITNLEVELD